MAEVSEIQELRAEMQSGFTQSKEEMRELMAQMHFGFQQSRKETDDLRSEMRAGFKEMREGFKYMHREFGRIDKRFQAVDAQFKEINYVLAVNAEGMDSLLKQPAQVKELRGDVDILQTDMSVVKETVSSHSRQLKTR